MTVRAHRLLACALCAAAVARCAPTGAEMSAGSAPDSAAQGGRLSGAGGMSSGMGGSFFVTQPATCSGSGYACMVPKCSSPTGTTVRGIVYDPAGKNPVYGAMVYFPDQIDSLGTISSGPGNLCGRCVRPAGNPFAGAVSGPDGSFVISQAPAGRQIPLVVQLGKWRRMIMVENIEACADNVVTDVRLPRSRSDGQKVSLPRIAIAAGAGDRVQCLLRRMGLDTSEFTNPDGLGSVNIYNQPSALGADPSGRYDTGVNGGVAFAEAATFWSDINQLGKYDLVVLSCGGNPTAADPTRTTPNPITDAAKASMVKYLSMGGRVLGEHYNSAWIRSFPAKSGQTNGNGVPSPLGTDVAAWYTALETSDATSSAVPAGTTAAGQVDMSFTKGKDFATWLVAAKATQTMGTLPLKGDVKRTAIDQLVTSPSAQRWLYQPTSATDPQGAASFTHFLSFNMTSGGQLVDRRSTDATNLCGRFLYTGLHVDSADTSTHRSDLDDAAKALTFPSCCAEGDLGPQEKAIEFMLFDLSSCLSLDADAAAGGVLF